ncbi:MAG: serine/threonine-protein kinase, partial [Polyangiales bacterium]
LVSAQPTAVGQVLGNRWRIDARIGKGAMAEVYRALDLQTAAYVALKILRNSVAGDPAIKQRFAREAEVQARVRHHNVAHLLATGVTQTDQPYLVVELLRGKTLRGVIKEEGRVGVRRASSYAWQMLQGLSAVHGAGILHRDLKPANIMLEPSPGPVERVVLIDFGFASVEGSAKLTQQGTVVGSLRYIAPERLRGEPVDARSDLYSVGVMLYELLMGTPPFAQVDDFELVDAHLTHDPPPVDDAVPPALDRVMRVALAKQQADRYPDAATMAAAIEAAAKSS